MTDLNCKKTTDDLQQRMDALRQVTIALCEGYLAGNSYSELCALTQLIDSVTAEYITVRHLASRTL